MRYYAPMAHHAYLLVGDLDESLALATMHIEKELGLVTTGNADVTTLRLPSFSVDNARSLASFAAQSAAGEARAIIVATSRIYEEAQNALLKLFEEPTPGLTLYLLVPSEGLILPTLRSRLAVLQAPEGQLERAYAFLRLPTEDRKQYLDKLLDRSKSDKQEEKQVAREEALLLVSELTRYVHELPVRKGNEVQKTELLRDLASFAVILHERSAPLKLIFEHLSLVLPAEGPVPTRRV